MLESGILRAEDGAYVLARPLPALAVPSTLQASLIARLDRLAPVRALVQTSAALGREFSYAVLKAVTALSDAELEPLLAQLVASELVQQRGVAPHAAYIFKHALVQDAAYETTQEPARVSTAASSTCSSTSSRKLRAPPDVLAYHCKEAWREKAIDFSIKAARMALERSAASKRRRKWKERWPCCPELRPGPRASDSRDACSLRWVTR